MNILFVASEASPLVKVGGLADVVGSLPIALRALGHDVRILLPLYGAIDRGRLKLASVSKQSVVFDGQAHQVELFLATLPGSDVPLYLADAPKIFGTKEVYVSGQSSAAWKLGIQRFVAFSAMAAALIPKFEWQPDVVHCHDWHTGLVPVLLAINGHPAKTVLTIHNLHNQGVWGKQEMCGWLGLTGQEHPLLRLPDEHHDINLLRVGIHAAHIVSTVSPTYAREILTPEYGEHLDQDLAAHHPPVVGILNGIDVHAFDPEHDKRLVATYNQQTVAAGKAKNKHAIQVALGLQPTSVAPLFVAVSWLSPQKGFDLLPPVINDIARSGGQVAILGSGWPEIEGQLHRLADDHVHAVAVKIGFDAGLAQQLYAAADFFLMPSRFEPCGLGQMIAMRYGTIPIVRETGGLRDTVVDLRTHPQHGTGFVFPRFAVEDFRGALDAAVQLYHSPGTLQQVIERGMQQDFSWTVSAQAYLRLYGEITNA